MEHTLLEMLEDIKDRLHQLDVALGINGALAAEVFFHLERKVEEAIAKAEGNARLIAAAPDLLEDCKALVNMIDYAVDAGMNGSISNDCPTMKKARIDIAKAEGK